MSAEDRKLRNFGAEQGGEDRGQGERKHASINGEQQRRAEEQMLDAPGAVGDGVSEVGAAGNPEGLPSGHDRGRGDAHKPARERETGRRQP